LARFFFFLLRRKRVVRIPEIGYALIARPAWRRPSFNIVLGVGEPSAELSNGI